MRRLATMRDGDQTTIALGPAFERTIVCLCGSTRFWRAFQAASLRETLAGRIVLSIGAASGTDDEHFGNLAPEAYAARKAELDALHLDKIALADAILILNSGQYIGQSTANEWAHAVALGRTVRWLVEPRLDGWWCRSCGAEYDSPLYAGMPPVVAPRRCPRCGAWLAIGAKHPPDGEGAA